MLGLQPANEVEACPVAQLEIAEDELGKESTDSRHGLLPGGSDLKPNRALLIPGNVVNRTKVVSPVLEACISCFPK